jgi:ABC-type sugar transport system permease subunit
VATITARRNRTWRQEIWRHRISYLCIAPFFVSFAVFQLYPLNYTIALSCHEWDGGRQPWYPIGLQNYTNLLFDDRVFRISLLNSIVYWIVLVPLLVGASLLLAVVLNISWLRGRGVMRTTFMLPFVTSGFIMGLIFVSFLDDRSGWLNAGLSLLGSPPVPWLQSTTFSKVGPVMVIFWRNVGYFMIIMLAGLQSIDTEIYEAATVDGATAWQKFVDITIPLMRPVTIFVIVVTTIMVLTMFEVVFAITGGGQEYSSQPLMLTLYQRAFRFGRLGSASALAVVISLITIFITFAQLKIIRGTR